MDVVVIVALVVPWVAVAFLCWVVYLLVKQHGRALIVEEQLAARLGGLEALLGGHAHAAQQPQGLEVGTAAPDFALPDLEGRERRLAELRGEPLLVTFFSPTCGFCQDMAPRLGALPDGAPRVLLVSQGSPEENRRLADEHGWRFEVLLDDDWDVGQTWGASGTPTGYLVDAEGRVASDLAVGADALLALLQRGDRPSNGDGNGAAGARSSGMTLRDVSESRIARNGLPAGTPAPGFTLPDLEGRKRSLDDFRGKRVLLVFSDPDCGPCQAMGPELADLRRRHQDGNLEVVMVSRGDPKANRAKAKDHGFDFPVLLQKGWKTSKAYAMFGTPSAYLIDERGVVAKDVAVGPDAILALAE
jgi:peroxiredoxin